jgi:hypothetical protein
MARPQKEGLDYFPLDVYFDEKMTALESLHKNDGFAWMIKFWQKAYRTNTGIVDLNGIFGVIQAENSRITTGKQAEIIQDCLKIGLIAEVEPGKYTSNGIQKRISEIIKQRENERKRKFSGSFPAENTPETGEIKGKERKGNKRKEERKRSVFVIPSIDQVFAYCQERKNKVIPQKFIDYYQSNGWKVGRNPMKDWKAAVRTWEQRDQVPARPSGKTPAKIRVLSMRASKWSDQEIKDTLKADGYPEAEIDQALGKGF